MSLMDLLLARPSAQDRFNQLMPLLKGGGSSAGFGVPNTPVTGAGGTPSHWEEIARRMAARKFGYTPEMLDQMDYIVTHESGWDPNAVNDSSGAYGIPQILPQAHPDTQLQGDPLGQIKWLLRYLNGYEGGVQGAYEHKLDTGWY